MTKSKKEELAAVNCRGFVGSFDKKCRRCTDFSDGYDAGFQAAIDAIRTESGKLKITDDRRLHGDAIAHWLESKKGEL